ncbi:MAG TPA: hypothetical protein VKW78_05635 [Terriglobales bacterium]|nr:hypothetical protein [Terriglobales bacterium]
MKAPAIIATIVLGATSFLWAQAPKKSPQPDLQHEKKAARVQILSPAPGTTITGSSLMVQLETSSLPPRHEPATFQIQLDSASPVLTSNTHYTFDQLAPGRHTLTVSLLTPKGSVVKGPHAVAEFSSALPELSPAADVAVKSMMPPTLQKVAMFLPKPTAPLEPPDGSGEMPLLSVIGLGVLVGGMVSAMKTRG